MSTPFTSHSYNTKGLFAPVPFTQNIMSTLQQKFISHIKGQNAQCEDAQQVIAPEPDMVGMLELSGCEFKRTMINMVKAIMEKYTTCKMYRNPKYTNS